MTVIDLQRVIWKDLPEMVDEVPVVIFNEKRERNRFIAADGAGSLQLIGWDAFDDVGDEGVEIGPKFKQWRGTVDVVSLDCDGFFLLISGEVECRLDQGADKALVIVDGRIHQVSEQLHTPPFPRAIGFLPGDIGSGIAEQGNEGTEFVGGVQHGKRLRKVSTIDVVP